MTKNLNLPDDKLPLIKTLRVDYLKRASGDLRVGPDVPVALGLRRLGPS